MPDLSGNVTDEWLVQQAQSGDQEAFTVLFLRYNQPICKFLWHIVHNYADVQDLAQQTFIKAHKKLPTLTRGTSFERWLYRIAENSARDYLRAKKRRPYLSSENLAEEYGDLGVAFEDRVEWEMLLELIQHEILKKLTTTQGKCFLLRLQGIEPAEIARRLHLSKGTVRTYLSKAALIAREEYLHVRNTGGE